VKERTVYLITYRIRCGIIRREFLFADIRQQGKMPCALNRDGKLTLMTRACAGYATRQNLCTLGKEPAELCNILIINRIDLVDTKVANLFAAFSAASAVTAITAIVAIASIVSIH
jgi:hypothetical protein